MADFIICPSNFKARSPFESRIMRLSSLDLVSSLHLSRPLLTSLGVSVVFSPRTQPAPSVGGPTQDLRLFGGTVSSGPRIPQLENFDQDFAVL
jgi:hypothetical protein